MEGLARLVSESMARNGMDCSLDYRRLHWSRWFRCETTFDLLQLPTRPGLFAIAEELIPAGEIGGAAGKRMLAVLQVADSDDLAITMSRLFSPDHPLKERIAERRIYARYTVVEDDGQRKSAQTAFQRWLAASMEAVSGIVREQADAASFLLPSSEDEPRSRFSAVSEPERPLTLGNEPSLLPSTESRSATVRPPAPLPSGF